MLASKTLLTVTLAATFVSGSFVGFAARGAKSGGGGAPPTDPNVVYAAQLSELESKGYDESEMAEARRMYAEYWTGIDYWWRTFLDVHRANTDVLDNKFEKARAALEAKHKARIGAK